MKYCFVVLFFSCKVLAITDSELLDQLTKIHGSQWNEVLAHSSSFLIREKLKAVLQQPQDWSMWSRLEEPEQQNIYRNAMTELGNFVKKFGINVDQRDFTFIYGLAKTFKYDWSSRSALAWYEGLKNTASPQGMETLMDVYEQVSATEVATKISLLRIMTESLVETENSLDLGVDFNQFGENRISPHLQESWSREQLKIMFKDKVLELMSEFTQNLALKDQNEEIVASISNFANQLKDESHDEGAATSAITTVDSSSALISGTEIAKSKKWQRINRQLASEPKQDEPLSPIWYFFIALLPILIGYLVHRKNMVDKKT